MQAAARQPQYACRSSTYANGLNRASGEGCATSRRHLAPCNTPGGTLVAMRSPAMSPVIQPGSTAKAVDVFSTIRTNSTPRAAAVSVLAVFLALPAATGAALAQEGLISWGAMVVDSRLHGQSFVEVA